MDGQIEGLIRSRAMFYAALLDELSTELGFERAKAAIGRALYARGTAFGQQIAKYAPQDFEQLAAEYPSLLPGSAELFDLHVTDCTDDGVEFLFGKCPQKQAWLDAGLADKRIEALCEIAAQFDVATFESAGFAIEAHSWKSGREGCCRLCIGVRSR